MPIVLTLAVYALAVARVTRLITHDRITEAPRRRLVVALWARTLPLSDARTEAGRRLDAGGDPPLGAYLVTCPWCVSTYVGAVAAPLWYYLGERPWLLIPAAVLAFSYACGFLATKEA